MLMLFPFENFDEYNFISNASYDAIVKLLKEQLSHMHKGRMSDFDGDSDMEKLLFEVRLKAEAVEMLFKTAPLNNGFYNSELDKALGNVEAAIAAARNEIADDETAVQTIIAEQYKRDSIPPASIDGFMGA